ncbi:MAG: 50S ribosomal protein L29 [Planctomycetes bacterium]|jgi:ribosomal protein L29|nr:50S ribosomal protein L29 [Planctomycetota bacterium]
MKKTVLAELRAKSADDLQVLAKAARETLMKARFAKSAEGKAITMQQRVQRRQVARLESLIAEKKSAAAQAGAKKPGAK